ncbi:MAG: STAS domain-containing protein [Planctomycetes bacterium]|nr:STAS domain-containing protein [Planctomycetota bacterium]
MVQLAQGWELEVERGPEWLFVHIRCTPEGALAVPPLADTVWQILEQHMTYRVVLECDELNLLHSMLIGELMTLNRRVAAHGGTMRLCGLSDENRIVLRHCRLDRHFPHNLDRTEAVMGTRHVRPRPRPSAK